MRTKFFYLFLKFVNPLSLYHGESQRHRHEKTLPVRRLNRVHNERRSGTSRNRTGDTRIFSPMLYQLS